MKTYFYCVLQGPSFDPSPFLIHPALNVSEYYQQGDIILKGRFQGQVREEGYLQLVAKHKDFAQFVESLYSVKPLLLNSQAEIKELHLFLGYTTQCNWEFEPDSLAKISELGLTLTLSCDQLEE